MTDLVTVKIRDLIETQSVATTDYMVLEKPNGTFKCEARYLKGATGSTPNVNVGNTNTLQPGQPATVTRRGSIDNPIFDFGIPKGDVGPQGPPGSASIAIDDSTVDTVHAWSGFKTDHEIYKISNDIQSIQGVKYSTDVDNLVMRSTKNGTIKDFKLYGKTLVNLGGVVNKTVNQYDIIIDSTRLLDISSLYTVSIKNKGNQSNTMYFNENVFSNQTPPFTIAPNETKIITQNTKSTISQLGILKSSDPTKTFNMEVVVLKGDFTQSMPTYFEGLSSVGNGSYIKIKTDNYLQNNDPNYLFTEKNILYKDTDSSYKKILNLRGLNEQDCDIIQDGKFYKRYDVRNYQNGDENNPNVITDKINTVYKLSQQLVYDINLIDLISYNPNTMYTIDSGPVKTKSEFYVDSNLGSLMVDILDRINTIENELFKPIVNVQMAMLSGDYRTAANILYPEDFVDNVDKEVIK